MAIERQIDHDILTYVELPKPTGCNPWLNDIYYLSLDKIS